MSEWKYCSCDRCGNNYVPKTQGTIAKLLFRPKWFSLRFFEFYSVNKESRTVHGEDLCTDCAVSFKQWFEAGNPEEKVG